MTNSRVSRGRKSQEIAAEYLKPVFPEAESRAASLAGTDIRNTPDWAIEVKARRGFNPTEWSKQASKNSGTDRPVAIMRPDGYGPERVGMWLAFMTLKDFRELVEYIQSLEEGIKELEEVLLPELSSLPDRTDS